MTHKYKISFIRHHFKMAEKSQEQMHLLRILSKEKIKSNSFSFLKSLFQPTLTLQSNIPAIAAQLSTRHQLCHKPNCLALARTENLEVEYKTLVTLIIFLLKNLHYQ